MGRGPGHALSTRHVSLIHEIAVEVSELKWALTGTHQGEVCGSIVTTQCVGDVVFTSNGEGAAGVGSSQCCATQYNICLLKLTF